MGDGLMPAVARYDAGAEEWYDELTTGADTPDQTMARGCSMKGPADAWTWAAAPALTRPPSGASGGPTCRGNSCHSCA